MPSRRMTSRALPQGNQSVYETIPKHRVEAAEDMVALHRRRRAHLRRFGTLTHDGSWAIALGPARVTTNRTMLQAGPQDPMPFPATFYGVFVDSPEAGLHLYFFTEPGMPLNQVCSATDQASASVAVGQHTNHWALRTLHHRHHTHTTLVCVGNRASQYNSRRKSMLQYYWRGAGTTWAAVHCSNHQMRRTPSEPSANTPPPSLYKVPTYSTRAGTAPCAPGGARHGGGNRAVTSQPRTGQSTSYGDVKPSYGGAGGWDRRGCAAWAPRSTNRQGEEQHRHRMWEPHQEGQGQGTRAQQTRRRGTGRQERQPEQWEQGTRMEQMAERAHGRQRQ